MLSMLTPKEIKYFINSNSHPYNLFSASTQPLLVSIPRSSSSCPMVTVCPSCTTTHCSEPQSGSLCREPSIPAQQRGADIRQPPRIPIIPRIRISASRTPTTTPTAPTISSFHSSTKLIPSTNTHYSSEDAPHPHPLLPRWRYSHP